MPISTSNKKGNVALHLKAYNNCDDVQLFWRVEVNGNLDEPVPDCLGFSIERQRQDVKGKWGETEILRNRVGFKDGNSKEDLSQPSDIWPFQTFNWTDHGANNGEVVRYRVVALKLPAGGTVGTSQLSPIADSGWSDEINVQADCENGISAYFNRGFVMSQFAARIARKNNWKISEIKPHIREIEEPLRRLLSGDLRKAILDLIEEVIENPSLSLYAVLFELDDDELITQLCHLKGRAHIVLSNGADKKVGGDENKTARKTLKKAGGDVQNRMLASKGLGHNKFAVVYDTHKKKSIKVFTGSTNWTSTGLCTQANNGILISDETIAGFYYDQWNRLKKAKDGFPPALVQSNAESPRTNENISVWFTRVRNKSKKNKDLGKDLVALQDIVNTAKETVLYVMFMPGQQPLETILQLPKNILVRGVVSTLISTTKEKFTLDGVKTSSVEFKEQLIQPDGIGKSFSIWADEIRRNTFTKYIGYAITHSKMIVIDPLSDNCKIITGSHNYSGASSEGNDENFVVIEGNKKLAEAYAVACLGTYAHYRWRAHVDEKLKAGEKIWSHLSDKPDWQKTHFNSDFKQLMDIWCK